MSKLDTLIVRNSGKKEGRGNADLFYTTVVSVIKDHILDPDFNVVRLSEILCVSQSTLYRKIKLSSGLAPIDLVRIIRMDKAGALMKSKRYSVREIAIAVGYNDIATFRKNFTEYYGMVPSGYDD